MKMKSLHDLFVEELRDLYSAENQLIKALPKMAEAASNEELRAGFEEHLEQTRAQAKRLEQICQQLDVTSKGKKCTAMEGLIEEGKELLEQDAPPAILDAGLIAAAQKVEHYEIASYGTVCTWAKLLELDDAAVLLHETLDEEKETDQKLTKLAEQTVNEEAEGTGEDDRSDESSTRASDGNRRGAATKNRSSRR